MNNNYNNNNCSNSMNNSNNRNKQQHEQKKLEECKNLESYEKRVPHPLEQAPEELESFIPPSVTRAVIILVYLLV